MLCVVLHRKEKQEACVDDSTCIEMCMSWNLKMGEKWNRNETKTIEIGQECLFQIELGHVSHRFFLEWLLALGQTGHGECLPF